MSGEVNTITAGLKDNSVNLNLETVLKFDRKQVDSDVKVIENVQSFLDKVKHALDKSKTHKHKNHRRTYYVEDASFTDFSEHILGVLVRFSDEDLAEIAQIVDDELRKYRYKGCKFYELVQSKLFRDYVRNILEKMNKISPKKLKKLLNQIIMKLRTKDFSERDMYIVNYINSLYSVDSTEKMFEVLKEFDELSSKQGLIKADTIKVVRNAIRSIIFDHYSNLPPNTRKDLRIKLGFLLEELARKKNGTQEGTTISSAGKFRGLATENVSERMGAGSEVSFGITSLYDTDVEGANQDSQEPDSPEAETGTETTTETEITSQVTLQTSKNHKHKSKKHMLPSNPYPSLQVPNLQLQQQRHQAHKSGPRAHKKLKVVNDLPMKHYDTMMVVREDLPLREILTEHNALLDLQPSPSYLHNSHNLPRSPHLDRQQISRHKSKDVRPKPIMAIDSSFAGTPQVSEHDLQVSRSYKLPKKKLAQHSTHHKSQPSLIQPSLIQSITNELIKLAMPLINIKINKEPVHKHQKRKHQKRKTNKMYLEQKKPSNGFSIEAVEDDHDSLYKFRRFDDKPSTPKTPRSHRRRQKVKELETGDIFDQIQRRSMKFAHKNKKRRSHNLLNKVSIESTELKKPSVKLAHKNKKRRSYHSLNKVSIESSEFKKPSVKFAHKNKKRRSHQSLNKVSIESTKLKKPLVSEDKTTFASPVYVSDTYLIKKINNLEKQLETVIHKIDDHKTINEPTRTITTEKTTPTKTTTETLTTKKVLITSTTIESETLNLLKHNKAFKNIETINSNPIIPFSKGTPKSTTIFSPSNSSSEENKTNTDTIIQLNTEVKSSETIDTSFTETSQTAGTSTDELPITVFKTIDDNSKYYKSSSKITSSKTESVNNKSVTWKTKLVSNNFDDQNKFINAEDKLGNENEYDASLSKDKIRNLYYADKDDLSSTKINLESTSTSGLTSSTYSKHKKKTEEEESKYGAYPKKYSKDDKFAKKANSTTKYTKVTKESILTTAARNNSKTNEMSTKIKLNSNKQNALDYNDHKVDKTTVLSMKNYTDTMVPTTNGVRITFSNKIMNITIDNSTKTPKGPVSLARRELSHFVPKNEETPFDLYVNEYNN